MVFKKQVYWVIYLFPSVVIFAIVIIRFTLPHNYFIFSPVLIAFLLLIILAPLFYQFLRGRHKLTITDYEIKSEGFLIHRSIKINEIDGFETFYVKSKVTTVGHYRIKQKKPSTKVVRIYPNYKNQIELTNWIKNNLTDLNNIKNQNKKAEDLKKDVFDVEFLEQNPVKRKRKIQTAKKVSLTLNTISILLSVLFFIPSWCFDYLLVFIILLPLLALISMFFLKGFLRLNLLAKTFKHSFNRKKTHKDSFKSEYFSDVSLSFALPSLLVLYLALTRYDLVDLKLVWMPAFFALLIIIVLFLIQLILNRLSFLSLVFLLPFLMIYTYGSVVAINCSFDSSLMKVSTYKIINKNTGRKAHQSLIKGYYYRVNVINWLGESGSYKSFDITKEDFESITIGDDIEIGLKKGYLNIPWYEVL